MPGCGGLRPLGGCKAGEGALTVCSLEAFAAHTEVAIPAGAAVTMVTGVAGTRI